jgi:hypothetical protein
MPRIRKPKSQLGDFVVPPLDTRRWTQSNGTYIAGRAALDEADKVADAMERKWGADRLRLLVGPELREKFDRQRYLFNQAIWHGELEDVRQQSARMVRAWEALNAVATKNGQQPIHPLVWEVTVGEGDAAYVAAIVPDNDHAKHVLASGRQVVVYTLEEIARLLQAMPAVAKAKQTFPGAEVTASRRSIDDPLGSIHDTGEKLDDQIPF